MEQGEIFHNRYCLKKRLGRGASSEVWQAVDMNGNADVALKIYDSRDGMDNTGVRLFRREFSLFSGLTHGNLVVPTAFDVCGNMPYLVMPYCENGSCVKLIGAVDEDTLWRLIGDVAAGLDYLHSRTIGPVVHQDIKPDNILVDSGGNFMLSDFGISTLVSTSYVSGDSLQLSRAGSFAYKGPEFYRKDKKPAAAGDIYSLGVTLFELMTGELPYGELGGMLQDNDDCIPAISGAYSEELKSLVRSCLCTEMWRRPTANDLVKDAKVRMALQSVSQDVTVPYYQETPQEHLLPSQPQSPHYENEYDNHYSEEEHVGGKSKRGWVAAVSSIAAVALLCVILIPMINKGNDGGYDPYAIVINGLDELNHDSVQLKKEGENTYVSKEYQQAMKIKRGDRRHSGESNKKEKWDDGKYASKFENSESEEYRMTSHAKKKNLNKFGCDEVHSINEENAERVRGIMESSVAE